MKKFILPALFVVVTLGFTSCGDDDEDDGAKAGCEECEVLGIKSTICDNGNGTAKVSAEIPGLGKSEEDIDIPEGQTFEEFADTQCSASVFGQVK
ncbi:hypothetical protein NBT05_04965 [Aquimarina sp. ERC-38]|uniref:hypothetical protein n=1 Tax=Aquimarina sp. ERC-38 TaxID=2949996 RepID=UPI0022462073|nr:hypothetical protein [Aquimarina sp. ERC-38]UZO81818.1 hypothetical protein NBT05_04965 [Aquimarina sp. ERC-38]